MYILSTCPVRNSETSDIKMGIIKNEQESKPYRERDR